MSTSSASGSPKSDITVHPETFEIIGVSSGIASTKTEDATSKQKLSKEQEWTASHLKADLIVFNTQRQPIAALYCHPNHKVTEIDLMAQMLKDIAFSKQNLAPCPKCAEAAADTKRLHAFVTNGWFVDCREGDGNSTTYEVRDKAGKLVGSNTNYRYAIDEAMEKPEATK